MLIALLRATRKDAGAKTAPGASRMDALRVAAIVATAIASFAWLAHSYFLSDDFTLLVQARNPWSWHSVFATRGGDGSFRPAGYLSYVASAKWGVQDPAPWHWIGFVMHAANAALLYALAVALGFSRFSAWLAGSLFALHASHPEAVVWIAGRFDLLATLFFLAATLAFVLSWREEGARRILYEGAAAVSMIIALLSKESAYGFPFVAVLLAVCSSDVRLRRMWWPLLVFFGLTAVFFAYRWTLLGGIGGYSGGVSFGPSVKALALRVWGVLFFPVDWVIHPRTGLILLTVVYAAALAALFLVRADRARLVFAAGFALLAAAPALSQLLIGADLEKARVLYLPSVGVCLLLATLCERLRRRERLAMAAALLLFQGTALTHNLGGWSRASQVVRAACVTAAECARGSGRSVLVTGLPRTLDGVYTFANGFAECVAMQGASPANAQPLKGELCRFAWDSTTNRLRIAH
jgi:hypothetical protein